MAIVQEPRILLLDEPTAGMGYEDARAATAQLKQMLDARRDMTIILTAHDMDVIQAMAHQVMVMKDGQVVEAGETQAVLAQPRHTYTQTLVQASAPAIERS